MYLKTKNIRKKLGFRDNFISKNSKHAKDTTEPVNFL